MVLRFLSLLFLLARVRADCPFGYYQSVRNDPYSGCTLAPAGTCTADIKSDITPSGSYSQRVYQGGEGATYTNVCEAGFYCLAGSTYCDRPYKLKGSGYIGRAPVSAKYCTPGNYCPQGSPSQIPCPTGFRCPYSQHENYWGEKNKCAAGTYTSTTGQHTCISCPAGKYQTYHSDTGYDGASRCNICPPGTFSSPHDNPTDCKACPQGTYNAIVGGRDGCVKCPSQTYGPEINGYVFKNEFWVEGGDNTIVTRGFSTLQGCITYCNEEKACKAFHYERPGLHNPKYKCYFKSSDSGTRYCTKKDGGCGIHEGLYIKFGTGGDGSGLNNVASSYCTACPPGQMTPSTATKHLPGSGSFPDNLHCRDGIRRISTEGTFRDYHDKQQKCLPNFNCDNVGDNVEDGVNVLGHKTFDLGSDFLTVDANRICDYTAVFDTQYGSLEVNKQTWPKFSSTTVLSEYYMGLGDVSTDIDLTGQTLFWMNRNAPGKNSFRKIKLSELIWDNHEYLSRTNQPAASEMTKSALRYAVYNSRATLTRIVITDIQWYDWFRALYYFLTNDALKTASFGWSSTGSFDSTPSKYPGKYSHKHLDLREYNELREVTITIWDGAPPTPFLYFSSQAYFPLLPTNCKLTKLVLDFHGTYMKSQEDVMNREVSKCSLLTTVVIRSAQLRRIPAFVKNLPYLRNLDLSGNFVHHQVELSSFDYFKHTPNLATLNLGRGKYLYNGDSNPSDSSPYSLIWLNRLPALRSFHSMSEHLKGCVPMENPMIVSPDENVVRIYRVIDNPRRYTTLDNWNVGHVKNSITGDIVFTDNNGNELSYNWATNCMVDYDHGILIEDKENRQCPETHPICVGYDPNPRRWGTCGPASVAGATYPDGKKGTEFYSDDIPTASLTFTFSGSVDIRKVTFKGTGMGERLDGVHVEFNEKYCGEFQVSNYWDSDADHEVVCGLMTRAQNDGTQFVPKGYADVTGNNPGAPKREANKWYNEFGSLAAVQAYAATHFYRYFWIWVWPYNLQTYASFSNVWDDRGTRFPSDQIYYENMDYMKISCCSSNDVRPIWNPDEKWYCGGDFTSSPTTSSPTTRSPTTLSPTLAPISPTSYPTQAVDVGRLVFNEYSHLYTNGGGAPKYMSFGGLTHKDFIRLPFANAQHRSMIFNQRYTTADFQKQMLNVIILSTSEYYITQPTISEWFSAYSFVPDYNNKLVVMVLFSSGGVMIDTAVFNKEASSGMSFFKLDEPPMPSPDLTFSPTSPPTSVPPSKTLMYAVIGGLVACVVVFGGIASYCLC